MHAIIEKKVERSPMAERMQERRVCERFFIPGAVINYKEESFLFSRKYVEDAFPVSDISRGGVGFLCNAPLKIDADVTMKIIIPGGGAPLILKGRVRWILLNPEKSYKYQIGVQFAPYGEKRGENDLEILQRIIALETQFLKGPG
jgi:hypothetical protein